MLQSLSLQNFIIIDKLNINFNKGFSVLTGETGAGKSIILEALLLTVGSKASVDNIKEDADKAIIVASYTINKQIINILEEYGIEFDNNEIIIRRVINKNGASKAFINDIPVSINLLKTIGNSILDLHGQFDNQKLLNKSLHIEILDTFIPKSVLEQTSKSYIYYTQALKEYNQLKSLINNLALEREYLIYVIEELDSLNLQENEELELIEKRKLCLEQEKLNSSLKNIKEIFNAENNVLQKINSSIRTLESLREILSSNLEYNFLLEKLDNSYSCLLDSEALIYDLQNSINNKELNLDKIEERLMLIRGLAKKYKVISNELPLLVAKYRNKLSTLQSSEDNLNSKQQELNKAKDNFIKQATILSNERKKAAQYLSNRINKELKDLHLKSTLFKVELISSLNSVELYNSLGFDNVTFKIFNNLSNEAKELNKIASGGELARIMLAIKLALAEKLAPLLIVFDEIDVGVGGEVAYSIGKKLKNLSKFSQVISVTHSHQIAALAEYHYKVLKSFNKEVNTTVKILDFESRVMELARMISSNKITEDAKSIALNLLKQQ